MFFTKNNKKIKNAMYAMCMSIFYKGGIVLSTKKIKKIKKIVKDDGDDLYRNFATIFYDLDDKNNMIDKINKINDLHIEAYLSPVHDRDVFADGTPKKPHHHLLLCFNGSRKVEFGQKIVAKLGGVGTELVYSKIGMARYLCHLDNKDKPLYDTNNVISFCGDYNQFLKTPESRDFLLSQIFDFIDGHNMTSLSKLIRHARVHEPAWWHFLQKRQNTSLILDYMKSFKYEIETDIREMEKIRHSRI